MDNSSLPLSDLENDENIFDDVPWAGNLILNLQSVVRKAAVKWLMLLIDIDPSEQGSKHHVEAVSKDFNNLSEKIVLDMVNLHEKYTSDVQKLVNRLEYLEKELSVEKSALCEQDKHAPLKELELKLKSQVAHYEYLFQIRKNEIVELREKYAKLSKILGISPKYFEKSPKKNSVTKLSVELDKLKNIVIENVQKSIERQQTELNTICDLCYREPSIRNTFVPEINADNYDSLLEILNRYNEEIEKWKFYYHQNKEIFDTLKNYVELKTSRDELEQNTNTKNLYKNRGGCLVTELRKRKILTSKIQTAETKLLQLSKKYLETNGKPILIFDQVLDDYINKKKEHMTVQRSKSSCNLLSPNRVNGRSEATKKVKTPCSVDTKTAKRKLAQEVGTTPSGHIKKTCNKKLKEVDTFLCNNKVTNNGSESTCSQDYNEFKKNIKKRSSSFCYEAASKIAEIPRISKTPL